jgi:hypothetical protein
MTFESSSSSCSITTRYCHKISSLVCLFLISNSDKNYLYCYCVLQPIFLNVSFVYSWSAFIS